MASIAPFGRMWPTAASTTVLLMIVCPFSIAYRWMAVLATPRAKIGIFSMRPSASSVQAMVYSAWVSMGGTCLRFEIRTWQGADRNRFSVLLPMSMSSSLCTPMRPTISSHGFSFRTYWMTFSNALPSSRVVRMSVCSAWASSREISRCDW